MQLMVKVFALVQILLVALFPAAHALRRDEFPKEFVFGASTSAYQVLLSLSLIIPFHLSPFSSRHFILQCTLLFLFLIMSYTIYERLKVQPMRMAGSQAHGIPSLMLHLVSIFYSHMFLGINFSFHCLMLLFCSNNSSSKYIFRE